MEHKCTVCDKLYKSYQSLWNHNKKFHKFNVNQMSKNVNQMSKNVKEMSNNVNTHSDSSKYNCKKCDNVLKKVPKEKILI